ERRPRTPLARGPADPEPPPPDAPGVTDEDLARLAALVLAGRGKAADALPYGAPTARRPPAAPRLGDPPPAEFASLQGHPGSTATEVRDAPLVSVILTTRDRPRFLAVALACYRRQTYPHRELIVVDDGDDFPADEARIAAVGGRLLRVEPGTPLGAKLNH